MGKKKGKIVISDEAIIHWEKEFAGRPPKMMGFSVSLVANKLEGGPCVWRADTSHGFAHEHQEWNGLRITLRGENYNKLYENCLKKISEHHIRYIELFKERSRKNEKKEETKRSR